MTRSNLISVADLRPLLGAEDLRLLDVRTGKDAAQLYAGGHLPGAVRVDLDRDLAEPNPRPENGGRHPLPERARFAALVGSWGITPATRVIAYDALDGANAAARAWWLLHALGHHGVQVLDGGLAAATAAGLPLTAEVPTIADAGPYPSGPWRLPTANLDAVDAARGDPARVVLDARAAVRFRGDSEPFDPVPGHVPGARNAPYADNLNAAGQFKSPAELRALYERLLDGRPPESAIVHCGSGVTACHTLLAMAHAGLPGAALCVGSWSEWCRQADRPIARGDD